MSQRLFPTNGLGAALFGVTPPFVKSCRPETRLSFGIMRFSNTLFEKLSLLLNMAKTHRPAGTHDGSSAACWPSGGRQAEEGLGALAPARADPRASGRAGHREPLPVNATAHRA